MKKAKIYKPSKTATQSGRGKIKKWLLEFETKQTFTNQLMGWDPSNDTLSSIKLEFDNKDKAIEYAKKNGIKYEVIEPKVRKNDYKIIFRQFFEIIYVA